MGTGLGLGDMNLAICEGTPPHTHTMKHNWGTKDIARLSEVHHTTILTYTVTH